MINTVITLFGGLAAVLVLYALGGLIRSLPPILRAVLAGGIPLVAYFVLIVGHWPGLDVVAIHISVFFATALVLFALTLFRRRGGRMHWAPKLLMFFFAGLTVLMGGFLYIANKGLPEPIGRWWLGSNGGPVYSGFSGVVPHNQEAATAISSELSKAHREAELGWDIDVSGLDGNESVRTVRVRVRNHTGLPVDRVVAELRLHRPGAVQATLTVPLPELDAGVYGGVLQVPASGRWLVELRLSRENTLHYQHTQELVMP
ncbi:MULTISPECIES: FixH family protein [unclassified Thiobacillus]|uniref:FixH family protein n=1 Tax=unclassified Thiobacillus TaxID=2646513 RepID=UPI0025F8D40A|nr:MULTISPECIES: FixH family protein [unclassified Thiobacillus]